MRFALRASWWRSLPYRRQRSQGLVEFGLTVAAVAFVALLGFDALGLAQQQYWGAVGPSLNPPQPPTGVFLHPTSVDPPVCTPATPTQVGTQITCTTTVRDIYPDVAERTPPLGTVDWYMDGTVITSAPIPACSNQAGAVPQYLPTITTGSTNTCPVPFKFTPTGAAWIGPHTLTARYGRTSGADPAWETFLSNHQFSAASVALTFTNALQWSPLTCTNIVEPPPKMNAGDVEIGHPMTCGITLLDASGGTPAPPPPGTPIIWSSVNSPTDPGGGIGVFTCDTGAFNAASHTSAIDIFNDHVRCPQPVPLQSNGTISITCYTDASGHCQVLYRRMFDSFGGGVGAKPSFTLSAFGESISPASAINVKAPMSPHTSAAFTLCSSTDGNVHLHSSSLPIDPLKSYRNNDVVSTDQVHIKTGSGTQLSCSAMVIDEDPSPPSDYANLFVSPADKSDPNMSDPHPPIGSVRFKLVSTGAVVASCSLVRTDVAPAGTVQAVGQAPFMSSCTPPAFALNMAAVANDTLEVDYVGTAAHTASNYGVPVQFNCGC